LLLLLILNFAFCSLHSDDDDPKKDVVAAPLLDVLTASKELPREETVVTRSLTVPPVKGTPTRASKRLKKIAVVGTSLEVHRPAASSKDVSIAYCI
jgi:hypothetical protein